MSRRGWIKWSLGIAGVLGLSHVVGVDDNLARALGVRPSAQPDPGDRKLLDEAIADQQQLIANLDALLRTDTALKQKSAQLKKVVRQQLAHLSDSPAAAQSRASVTRTSVARAFAKSSRRREKAALQARDVDLATVLASLSSSHAQIARTVARAS